MNLPPPQANGIRGLLLSLVPRGKHAASKLICWILALFTLYAAPGCVYEYTVGDKLAAAKAEQKYKEKWLTTCMSTAWNMMEEHGEDWEYFINDDPYGMPNLDCKPLIPAMKSDPQFYEYYDKWQDIKKKASKT